jgi:hypothetical protein
MGTYSGMLTIQTNANVASPNLSVALNMGAKGVIVTNNLATTAWSFPSTPNGMQSTINLGITNAGNVPLQVALSGLSQGAVYSLQANPTVETVTPGSTTFTAVFSPNMAHATYPDNGTLTVSPVGGVLCKALPSSWQTPSITLTGSSP